MTEDVEWKMIRFFGIPPNVVRWEIHWLDKNGIDRFHPHTGDMSMIEPAPPNDWRPACYMGNYGEPCEGKYILICGKTLRCECEECPYRKME